MHRNGKTIKVGLVSLGCPKNLVDSEEMLGTLVNAGCEIVSDQNTADVILVNTCGFIEDAKEESIDIILEMTRLKTDGICKSVVVTGCLAQRYAEELGREIPEVDAVVGVGQISSLPEIVQLTLDGHRVVDQSKPTSEWVETTDKVRATPAWTAYLKISDGCDNRCSYCAIPDIRGSFRSRPMKMVLKDAEKLGQEGVLELNLVGQDITRYGEDIGSYGLVDLLRELTQVDGPRWIRLLYCYPTRISDELIDLVANEPRIVKYLDIPMQHGSDETLRRMNRSGSSSEYLSLVRRIRERVPEIALRTSFIVGFPGETRQEFDNLLRFAEEIQFDRVGVFQYSAEEGTPAAAFAGQVSDAEKQRRYDKLMSLQQQISLARSESMVGSKIDVLIEEVSDSAELTCRGRSYRDAPDIDGEVTVNGYAGEPGVIIEAQVSSASHYDLTAEAIQ